MNMKQLIFAVLKALETLLHYLDTNGKTTEYEKLKVVLMDLEDMYYNS